jgi:GNAT superfamily N-acetyltransferase
VPTADAARTCHQNTVLLADGSEAVIRPLAAQDRALVEDLFAAVAPAHLYTRFFGVGRQVVTRHIDHLFDPEAATSSYLLERDGVLLGICDIELLDPHSAEIAFLVADGAHGLGIATLLLEHAATQAWAKGITTFVADVLATNHPMLEVFHDAGFDVRVHAEHADVAVNMSTRRTSAALAATADRHRHAEHLRRARGSVQGRRSAT